MNIVTHSGAFHVDDVFAVATLLLIYPDATITRTRNEALINAADFAVDVGGVYDPLRKRFDHHQEGRAGVRENGIPYASFGLVWKEYGEKLTGSLEAAEMIDEHLVMSIDGPDNGVPIYEELFGNIRPYTIRDFIYSYVANGEMGEDYLYAAFISSVGIAKDLLTREIAKARERVIDLKEVERIVAASPRRDVIVFEKALPWEAVLAKIPEALFAVYMRKEGNWGVKSVPSERGGLTRKKSLPAAWGAKKDEELQMITGVPDALFCHNGLFLAGAKSKEGALKLAEIALNS